MINFNSQSIFKCEMLLFVGYFYMLYESNMITNRKIDKLNHEFKISNFAEDTFKHELKYTFSG